MKPLAARAQRASLDRSEHRGANAPIRIARSPKVGIFQPPLLGRFRAALTRVFEALRGLGYTGGYDAVRRYARTWRKGQLSASASAYVPLSFAPGEAYQFDWSHEVVLIGGATVTVKVAHIRLCHSRMLFV